MGKYVIKLTDSGGLSCRVDLSLPFFINQSDPDNSEWRVLDGGFLIFYWGGCLIVESTPGNIISEGDLHLCHGKISGVNILGVTLYKFVDNLCFANDSGTGVVHQPWAANCKPGKVTWALLE
jgi:hypothetical protein